MLEGVKVELIHSRMLDVSWELSEHIAPPGGFRLEYKCQPLDGGTVYLYNVVKLHSLQNSCQLGPIRSPTLCVFTLFAIYNEASLDAGVEFAFKDENNQKEVFVTRA